MKRPLAEAKGIPKEREMWDRFFNQSAHLALLGHEILECLPILLLVFQELIKVPSGKLT
jgi:hypothetical protein